VRILSVVAVASSLFNHVILQSCLPTISYTSPTRLQLLLKGRPICSLCCTSAHLKARQFKRAFVTFDFPERCPLAHSRGHSLQVSQLEDSRCQCCQCPASRGKYWTGLRASVERVFHSGQLAAYAPLMNEAAEKLNTRLAAKAGTAAEEGAAAGIGAVAAPVAAAPAGATHEDGAAAGEGGDADAAAVAGKAAAQGEAAEAAAGATAEAALTSINLSAALATMTLEVIGTSAFG